MTNRLTLRYTRLFNCVFHPSYFSDVINPLVEYISSQKSSPCIIGIAGGAASGKTTLASILQLELSQKTKFHVVVHSIDDYHYSAVDRKRRHIIWRGAPGAHNMKALETVWSRLKSGTVPLLLPKFNKAKDDYDPPLSINHPIDIFLFEGLIVGMRHPDFPQYANIISKRLDLLIFIEAIESHLKRWRIETEAKTRAITGHGYSEATIARYWDEQLGPMLYTHINPIKQYANVVITVSPKREYKMSFT